MTGPDPAATAQEAAEFFRSHARAPEQPTREAQRMLDILCDHARLVPNGASVDRYGQLCAAQALRELAAAHQHAEDRGVRAAIAAMPAAMRDVYRAGVDVVVRDALARAGAYDHQIAGGT